jgi:hypothetical protein
LDRQAQAFEDHLALDRALQVEALADCARRRQQPIGLRKVERRVCHSNPILVMKFSENVQGIPQRAKRL